MEDGDALSSLVADPVNLTTSYANAYFEGMYRGIDEAMLPEMNMNERSHKVLGETPVSLERYTVFYSFLPPDTDYMDIAAAVREYMTETDVPVPLFSGYGAPVSGTDRFGSGNRFCSGDPL